MAQKKQINVPIPRVQTIFSINSKKTNGQQSSNRSISSKNSNANRTGSQVVENRNRSPMNSDYAIRNRRQTSQTSPYRELFNKEDATEAEADIEDDQLFTGALCTNQLSLNSKIMQYNEKYPNVKSMTDKDKSQGSLSRHLSRSKVPEGLIGKRMVHSYFDSNLQSNVSFNGRKSENTSQIMQKIPSNVMSEDAYRAATLEIQKCKKSSHLQVPSVQNSQSNSPQTNQYRVSFGNDAQIIQKSIKVQQKEIPKVLQTILDTQFNKNNDNVKR